MSPEIDQANLPLQTPIEFTFTVDRFGFRPGEQRSAAFANDVVKALDQWEQTIRSLFGDFDRATDLAIQAGMLPEHPRWKAIAERRAKLRDELATAAVPKGGDHITDHQMRATLEDARLYLQDLFTWSQVFHAGAIAAAIASAGSLEGTEERRRLHGLQTLASVFPLAIDRHDAREKFEKLKSAGESLVPPALVNVWNSSTPSSSSSFGSFGEVPTRLQSWLDALKQEIDEVTNQLRTSIASADAWPTIENAFWQLWQRKLPGIMERHQNFRDVTVLDLIHAARHGSIPVVPPRGGRLSISQWSRIFGLARTADDLVPSDIARHAAASLGVEELATERPKLRDLTENIVVIRPQSSRSPAWDWTPDPRVRAIVLMPADIVVADQGKMAGVESGAEPATAVESPVNARIENAILSLKGKLFFFIPIRVSTIEFIELGNEVRFVTASKTERLPTNLRRTFFGFDAEPDVGTEPYVGNPTDVHQLLNPRKPSRSLWTWLSSFAVSQWRAFSRMLPSRDRW
jgi:hypothetical protein